MGDNSTPSSRKRGRCDRSNYRIPAAPARGGCFQAREELKKNGGRASGPSAVLRQDQFALVMAAVPAVMGPPVAMHVMPARASAFPAVRHPDEADARRKPAAIHPDILVAVPAP